MKNKIFFLPLAALLLTYGLRAQQQSYSQLTASTVTTGATVNLTRAAVAYHQVTWNVTGSLSACTVAIDSSSDGVTWTTGGVISGQTCTSAGQSSVVNATVNYVRIDVTAFTGSGSVIATYGGYTNNPSGGGGSGCTVGGSTGSVQVNNGSGGCTGYADLLTNSSAWLGIGNALSGGAPQYPLDVNLTSTTGAQDSGEVSCAVTASGSTPADTHCLSGTLSLSGTSAWTNGSGLTNSYQYNTITDTRAPSAASVIDHELTQVNYINADGGSNLTCTVCDANYNFANFDGSGETVTTLAGISAGGSIEGSGTVGTWEGVGVALASVVSGSPTVDYETGYGVSDPANATYVTDCATGVAVGSGVCTAVGSVKAFGYYEDSAAPNSLAHTSVSGYVACIAGTCSGHEAVLDAGGSVNVGDGSNPALWFRDGDGNPSISLGPSCVGSPAYALPCGTDGTLALTSQLTGKATLTTTTGTSDSATITWPDSGTHTATVCTFSATNSSGASNIATAYISAVGSNSVTLTHTGTSGMTYSFLCTDN